VNHVLNLQKGDCWCSAWHGADVIIDNNRAGSLLARTSISHDTSVCSAPQRPPEYTAADAVLSRRMTSERDGLPRSERDRDRERDRERDDPEEEFQDAQVCYSHIGCVLLIKHALQLLPVVACQQCVGRRIPATEVASCF
jgi:hypothetical protein